MTDEESQAPRVLAAMFGLAVMAAAVTEVRSDRAVGLALAYVFVRLVAAGAWRRGQVVVDWPVAQLSAGVIPWVVSLFVGAPGRYWLWAAGLGVDLVVMFAVSGQRLVAAVMRRNEGVVARHGVDPARLPTPEAVESDVPHLAERLGLYVIIVLGECIIQVILAASEVRWDLSLLALTTGAFVLLVSMWALSLVYGFAGVPHLTADVLPARIAMALHCFTTGAIAALGAGLGAAVAHPHGDLAVGSAGHGHCERS